MLTVDTATSDEPTTEPRTITIVMEPTESGDGWGAYVPTFSGACLATGQTYDECLGRILEGIALHVEVSREFGTAP